jgi:outer membrane receptor protein involved in Fe transport
MHLVPVTLIISNVEVIPGSASALYGMNAINGTANFITKDPFTYQGLSFQQRTGVNHVNDANSNATLFNETAIRWAKAYKNRFAFKINAVYSNGVDWYADNRTDLNPAANYSTNLTGSENPGKDLVNIYGDESSNRKTITLNGKQYVVSRTGYAEKEVSKYNLANFKGDVTLAYRLKKAEISYTFRVAHTNTIYQRTNRFRLDDYITQQHAFAFKTNSIQLRAYANTENTGNSYNIRSIAENIERFFKPDDEWYKDFSNQFNSSIANGAPVTAAMNDARNFADKGRPQPNTSQMNELIARLRAINDWDSGAALQVKAVMSHAEMQHDLSKDILKELNNRYKFSVMYGMDYREYVVVPDGNYFINPVESGASFIYYKFGGFVQGTKYFSNQKIKVNAVLRVDKNEYFSAKLNPRIAIVYSPVNRHNFRLAVQQGYRFPSLFEAFSNINSGGVKRVGGLPVMSKGIFEHSYLRTSVDAFQAANTNDVNRNGLTLPQAIEKNKKLLKQNNYTYLQPEQVKGLEAGYRSVLFNEKVLIDVDFYYNVYRNLMAQVEANIPKAGNIDSVEWYLNDKQKQDRYRLWTNSQTVSYNYGSTIGISWEMPGKFGLSGNVTFAKLDRTDQKDGLEDGFNTPKWIYNLTFGNPSLFTYFGFQVNYRRQSNYLWQSSLATGTVPAYSTVDAQVQYNNENNRLSIKLGATNLLNRYYYSFIGGPAIGGFYYCTTTISLF